MFCVSLPCKEFTVEPTQIFCCFHFFFHFRSRWNLAFNWLLLRKFFKSYRSFEKRVVAQISTHRLLIPATGWFDYGCTVNFTTYVQKTSDSKNGMINLLLILRVCVCLSEQLLHCLVCQVCNHVCVCAFKMCDNKIMIFCRAYKLYFTTQIGNVYNFWYVTAMHECLHSINVKFYEWI